MEGAGFKDVSVELVKCFHHEKAVGRAVEDFYGMGNPSIKLLMKGFHDEFLESTKPFFRQAYDEKYKGGRLRQFEGALLVVGRKAS